ncbi:MAG: TetR/AcrR family transcriptional regulator [Gammaproteobacteria bacterium]
MSVIESAPTTESVASEHRSRLLHAMAVLAASKGLAATTIADIVREAGVSKRTFYEHFSSKEACFFCLYQQLAAAALRTLRDALSADRPWQSQIGMALNAYFSHLSSNPGLTKALFVEVHHLGSEGLAVRREVMRQFADFMLEVVNGQPVSAAADREHQVLTATMAMAAVGGINELVIEMIEQGRAAAVDALTPAAAEMVRALAHADIADL